MSDGIERRVDAVIVGEWIDYDPWFGKVEDVFLHGQKIGDGSANWYTFRVRQPGAAGGGLRSYTDAVGPLKETDILLVVPPPVSLDQHPYPREVQA